MSGIAVDYSEFNLALRQYIRKTSKTLEEVVNWKANDLMLTSAKFTPKSKITNAQFNKAKARPQLVTHRTGRKFGNAQGKGYKMDQWNLVNQAMQMRTLGKGFMRSAWIKASGKIPKSRLSKVTGANLEARRMENSRADVRKIAGKIHGLSMDLLWNAHSSGDASLKQSMVDRALRLAVPSVTASMRAYLERKMEQEARAASASTVRAIAGAFR